jgi:hypothetical protein
LIRYDAAKRLGIAVALGVPDALYRFIGTRRVQLRQLRELDSQLKCIHQREPEPHLEMVYGTA